MAGERQHYIPRFLLKGFSSRTTNQKAFVWYFRKGENPIEVSIRDIALEKSFYGETGKGSLDETITENEKDYSRVIAQVREEGYISQRNLDILTEFVFNLVVRTRNTRKGLTEVFGTFINMFSQNISNPHTTARLLKNYRKENKKALTRTYQREELSKRLAEYRRLIWSVKRFEPNVFIFGDIGAVQFNFKTKEFHSSIFNKMNEGALLLSIAHDTLLVGISDDNLTLPSPNDINTGIAELNMDFFVASSNGEREKAYSEIMGTRATLLDDKTASELKREYFRVK